MSWKNGLDTFCENFDHLEPIGKSETTYVYFITDGIYIKIGVADCIGQRLLQLQTGNGRRLILLMRIPFLSRSAALDAEKAFHSEFDNCRLIGEWFDIAKNPRFLYYYFRQSPGGFTDENMKFVLKMVIATDYHDPNAHYDYWIEKKKTEFFDWYAGSASREVPLPSFKGMNELELRITNWLLNSKDRKQYGNYLVTRTIKRKEA